MKIHKFPKFVWVVWEEESGKGGYHVLYEDAEEGAIQNRGARFAVYELKEYQTLDVRVVSAGIKKA